MNKHDVQIPASSYKKLQKKLQKYKIKIGGMDIGDFLIANSSIDDAKNSAVIRTKRIILHIGGDFDSRPEDLNMSVNLETILGYGFNEYMLLRRRLEQLAKSYDKGSKVSAKETHECNTVENCIDLLNSKIPKINIL